MSGFDVNAPSPINEALTWALFETAPWDHHLRLPGHHLARWLLGRGHKVAYLSAPVSPWHFLSKQSRELAKKRWNADGPVGRWHSPNFFTYIPRTWLPIHRQWPFDSNATWNGSEYFSRPRAGEVMRSSGFDRVDVLVVQNYQMPHIVRHLQPRLFVVRLEDDIAEFPRMPRIIARRYGEIIADADLVTITARALEPLAKRKRAHELYYLPNGVNLTAFERPEQLPERPGDMPNGPVAIYTGALDSWFDEELLAAAAQRLPEWNFLLIGPVAKAFDQLNLLNNIIFLGARPQEQLPTYLWHSQAGIIPFRRNRLVESVAPLKLFEYLAAGLPVISTRWSEMESLQSPAILADNPAQFANAIESAQSQNTSERTARVDWARQYDWHILFTGFENKLRGQLAQL